MDFFEKIKNFVNIYKVNLILGGFLLFLIILGNWFIYHLLKADKNVDSNSLIKEIDIMEEIQVPEVQEEMEIFYKVDIKGAVKKTGVYALKKGSRIIDVINIAGGLLNNADTTVINLSKYITDEMVIVIYTKEQVENFKKVIEEEKQSDKQCVIYNEIIQNDGCKNSEEEKNENEQENNYNVELDQKISINTADISLLMELPNIGESKAKSIIEYRSNNGPFITIEDIMKVSGIGEKLFESIKEYITV